MATVATEASLAGNCCGRAGGLWRQPERPDAIDVCFDRSIQFVEQFGFHDVGRHERGAVRRSVRPGHGRTARDHPSHGLFRAAAGRVGRPTSLGDLRCHGRL